jgi:hypothetical protein
MKPLIHRFKKPNEFQACNCFLKNSTPRNRTLNFHQKKEKKIIDRMKEKKRKSSKVAGEKGKNALSSKRLFQRRLHSKQQ